MIDLEKAFAVADGYIAAVDQAENFLPPPRDDIELLCRALLELRPPTVKPTWKETVAAERTKLGRDPTLDELIDLARPYRMTDAEIEEQRQSWCRQDMD